MLIKYIFSLYLFFRFQSVFKFRGTKCIKKSAMWRLKNEGLFISFSGFFFPTSPFISLIFMTSHGYFLYTLSPYLHFFRNHIKSCSSNFTQRRTSKHQPCDVIKRRHYSSPFQGFYFPLLFSSLSFLWHHMAVFFINFFPLT